MKHLIAAVLALTAITAQAECPKGQVRYTEPDGTQVIIRATGIVTRLSPNNKITHSFEPISEEQRNTTLTECRIGDPTTLLIYNARGQFIGTIRTR